MSSFGVGLLLGLSLGNMMMYLYIHAAGLFRTRKEFYAARKANGYSVPEDWDKEDEL